MAQKVFSALLICILCLSFYVYLIPVNPVLAGTGTSYSVTFTASGLAAGTTWAVYLNGTTQTSTSSTITFSDFPDGDYSYVLLTPDGYALMSPTSAWGTLTVAGANTGKIVTYQTLTHAAMGKYTYGLGDIDSGSDLVRTPDGGFIIVGRTVSNENNRYMWVVKVDAIGVAQWNKTFAGSLYPGTYDEAWGIVEASDGGYVIVGCTIQFLVNSADVWLLKIDSNGNKLWDKTYDMVHNDDYGFGLVATADGGYAIVGYTFSANYGGDVWLIKTDVNGNALWNQTYKRNDNIYNQDCGNSMVATSDGGYALVGYTHSYESNDRNVWFIKTDANGNELWNKTYGGMGYDYGQSLVEVSDGYTIVGYTDSYGAGNGDVWLLKVDTFGNALWNKTYGQANHDDGYDLVTTADGGYVISGSLRVFDGSYRSYCWLVKVDANGNKLWDKTYAKGYSDDYGRSLIATGEGGYAIAGIAYSSPWPSYAADYLLVVTDSLGNAGYTPTVITSGEGSVPAGNQTYNEGATVNLQAIPAAGWIFTGWGGDATGTTDIPIVMISNMTITAAFIPIYSVSFTQAGLAAGTSWSVTFNGTTKTSTSGAVTFTGYVTGTYPFSVAEVLGYHFGIYSADKPSALNDGIITVGGANLSIPIVFTSEAPTSLTYSAVFTASGLPLGTPWSITLNGVKRLSTTSQIRFNNLSPSTYTYTITIPDGYDVPSNMPASLTITNTDIYQTVTFTTQPPPTPTPTPTSTPTPTPTTSPTPSASPTPTSTVAPTSTPTSTPTPTASPTTTASPTPSPTTSPTVTPSSTPTSTPETTTQPTSLASPTTEPTTSASTSSSPEILDPSTPLDPAYLALIAGLIILAAATTAFMIIRKK